jgi:hypothetical protein
VVKLTFNNTEEFEDLFKNRKKEVTDGIVHGIEKAMQGNKRTAELFEISFVEYSRMFEISLPRSQWVHALEACLEHYHEMELADEAIDTWKLLEAAKVW